MIVQDIPKQPMQNNSSSSKTRGPTLLPLAISFALFLLLSGCENSGQNIQVQVNESNVSTNNVTETIHINNCGGNLSAEKTIERPFIIVLAEGNEPIIKQAISNKYAQQKPETKKYKITAPPNTNMIFLLTWTEEIRSGNVTVNGETNAYTVRITIAVEQKSTANVGCSSSSIPNQTLPQFPWPPPKPSATALLTLGSLKNQNGATLTFNDVDMRITEALTTGGYDDKSYYGVANGFAVVTRLEQINSNGFPENTQRWVSELAPISIKDFSINKYFEALFSVPKGHYRIFVFIVTSDLALQSGTPVSQIEAKMWIVEGANKLPEWMKAQAYTKEHTCTVYVYEFIQLGLGAEANQNIPSNITGKQHLERAGIWNTLER